MQKIDLTGKRFGRLVVLEQDFQRQSRLTYWVCKCDCGKVTSVYGGSLRKGTTKSCGCLSRELASTRNSTHHLSGTRTYRIWCNMKNRCTKSYLAEYKNYGGKGIKVCERWQTFENFLEDMGECPPDHSIDRIDNDKDYCPENCRWADRVTQCNNKSKHHLLTYNSETMTLAQWARRVGMKFDTLERRINASHWDIERALFTPVRTPSR